MERILTDKAEVIFDGDCLVRIHINERAELEAQDMIAINNAKFKMVKEKRYVVLFIPGTYASISADARKISASKEINRNAIAKAILVSTTHQRIIGNFFIKFNRPPAPTSVFNNEKEALMWLEEMKKASSVVH